MGLKVFDLECEHGHVFEGWFASHEDYDAQQTRGLLTCPVCASAQIIKRLSAPRLNVSHLRQPAPSAPPEPAMADTTAAAPGAAANAMAVQAEIMRKMRELMRQTENVGTAFAAEARRIHEGEAVQRPIRGTASAQERAELAEDGIDVLSVPAFLDDEQLQ